MDSYELEPRGAFLCTVPVVPKRTRTQPAPPPSPDRRLAYALLPLRLFLGVTFVYAGLQKIADPGFLHPGSATYIGSQLTGFAAHSPIGFLITALALPAPQLAGIGVIVAELVVGIATVLGIYTRWAAVAGALLNFVLFLTASWTVQPYFLGSDGIYTVAWITLVLTGDQGLLTAQPLIVAQLGLGRRTPSVGFDPTRRRLLLQAGGAAVALVWALSVGPPLKPALRASTTPSPRPTEATPSAAPTPTGTKIGTVADLRAQGFLPFNDPAGGDPALAVQLADGNVVAFDAVCTHAGCQVNYDTGQKLFVCPCHGATFDPAHSAAGVDGPAPTPLTAINNETAAAEIYTG